MTREQEHLLRLALDELAEMEPAESDHNSHRTCVFCGCCCDDGHDFGGGRRGRCQDGGHGFGCPTATFQRAINENWIRYKPGYHGEEPRIARRDRRITLKEQGDGTVV